MSPATYSAFYAGTFLYVAAAVFFADAHVSVGDIEHALQGQGARIGKATVYRTLGLLATAGGLGLPDRDYYVKDDARSKDVLAAYRALESESPDGFVQDPFAARLAGERGMEISGSSLP